MRFRRRRNRPKWPKNDHFGHFLAISRSEIACRNLAAASKLRGSLLSHLASQDARPEGNFLPSQKTAVFCRSGQALPGPGQLPEGVPWLLRPDQTCWFSLEDVQSNQRKREVGSRSGVAGSGQNMLTLRVGQVLACASFSAFYTQLCCAELWPGLARPGQIGLARSEVCQTLRHILARFLKDLAKSGQVHQDLVRTARAVASPEPLPTPCGMRFGKRALRAHLELG